MEASHLLSRIEGQNGPAILATNLHRHLDPAFVWCFHLTVEFRCPDATARS